MKLGERSSRFDTISLESGGTRRSLIQYLFGNGVRMSASKRAKIARLFAAGADGVYRAAIEAKVGTVRIAAQMKTEAAEATSEFKEYLHSDKFETDIDRLIGKLQIFDSSLVVPDLR